MTESLYPVVTSKLNLGGQQFQTNRENWKPVLEQFEEALGQVSAEGNDISLRRHQGRGQLLRALDCLQSRALHADTPATARDRIAILLDPGSPFLELCPFAGFQNKDSTPCANIVAGIGNVRQVRVHLQPQSQRFGGNLTVNNAVGDHASSCRISRLKAAVPGMR
jgi:hypothetical protein